MSDLESPLWFFVLEKLVVYRFSFLEKRLMSYVVRLRSSSSFPRQVFATNFTCHSDPTHPFFSNLVSCFLQVQDCSICSRVLDLYLKPKFRNFAFENLSFNRHNGSIWFL